MNQFFTHRTQSESLPQSVAKSLAALRQEIEQVFWESGDNLEKAVSNLNDLNSQFRKLDTALGHDAETALLEMIETINGHLSKLKADCETFNALSSTLRKSISVIGAQVRELDSVVRTIANISVNARIQGNSLMPPRPQVSAFIERLAAMSSESEGILREINDAMASVIFDVSAMEDEQRELLRELTTTVFPAIAGFTSLARQMRAGQTGIKEATVTLAQQADGIRRDVSMLIVALQIGDSTRQRIERVEDTLRRSTSFEGAGQRVLYELALALDDSSSQTALEQVSAALETLTTLRDRADRVLKGPSNTAIMQSNISGAANGAGERDHLLKSLSVNDRHFEALKSKAGTVRERLAAILQHEGSLRRIAHEIRLSGVNAVIICAKLGEDGRALRELAHWLRELTDESDEIIPRLQTALGECRDTLRQLTEEQVAGLETLLGRFAQDAERLDRMIRGSAAVVDKTVKDYSVTSANLPKQIGRAHALLTHFLVKLAETRATAQSLRFSAEMLPMPSGALQSDPALWNTLEALFTLYTMESERQIHAHALGRFASSDEAQEEIAAPVPPPQSEPPAPSGAGDLDDIFF